MKKELGEELSDDEIQEGRMKDLSMKVNNIVAKMKKDRQMKGFADKFKRDVMRSMDIEKSLEKVLPDFIAGKEIQKLVKEQETDPVAKAQDNLEKQKKIADLKKQISQVKSEKLDDDDKETIKPIIKQLKKSVTAHDKQAKQLQKDIDDETDLEE